jgi:hypothetical protein
MGTQYSIYDEQNPINENRLKRWSLTLHTLAIGIKFVPTVYPISEVRIVECPFHFHAGVRIHVQVYAHMGYLILYSNIGLI